MQIVHHMLIDVEQIAAIFEETAANEKEHAKVFFKHLEGGPVEITATYPAGVIATVEYGQELNVAFRRGNVAATQFHPEKSAHDGLALLANFARVASGETR